MRISDWSSDVCSSDLVGHEEVRLRGKDGQYRWFIDTTAHRLNEAGEVIGYIGTLTDIDDMRRLGEQLHQSQKMERSEERRVGKECVSTCRSRWSPDH